MEDDAVTTVHAKEAIVSKGKNPESSCTNAGDDVGSRDALVPMEGRPARRRGCRDLDEFEVLDGALLGEGTYG